MCALCIEARNIDIKRAAFADFALGPNGAVIKFDDLFADEKTESGAANRPGGRVVYPVEFLK